MLAILSILLALPLLAQTNTCSSVKAWSACEIVFDLEAGENAANAELRGEFRSPGHKTYLLNAFRDGERRLVIRVAPTEPGPWDYLLTSSLKRLDGQMGQLTAGPSDSPGFVHTANVHHFATEDKRPHLWMSTGVENFSK